MAAMRKKIYSKRRYAQTQRTSTDVILFIEKKKMGTFNTMSCSQLKYIYLFPCVHVGCNIKTVLRNVP
jgi:hypothetical protein